MADQNLNQAELARLAEIFRRYATETEDPDFRQTFLRTAEELERLSRKDSGKP